MNNLRSSAIEPIAEATYEQQRDELVRAHAFWVCVVVLCLDVIFLIALLLVAPAVLEKQWWFNAAGVLSPALALVLLSLPFRISTSQAIFVSDMVFTLSVVGRAFVPEARTGGVCAFTLIKLAATSILIPWSPAMQIISTLMTVGLYWLCMWGTGRLEAAGPDLAYVATAPLFGGLLSILGAQSADVLRRAVFRQQRAAESQAKMSSHFAATMSHELRNMLGAVLGYGEILADVTRDSKVEVEVEAPRRLQALAHQGIDIINVTLEISRADSGALTIERQPIRLAALFAEVEGDFAMRGGRSVVELQWHADPELEIVSDPVKLKMILRNLVGNAIKFTEHGEIVVAATRHDDGVEIAVADSGEGISAVDCRLIFDAFQQGGPSQRRRDGAGLGLYVVHRLVTALGGRITVESTLGHGSTFRIVLPSATGAAVGDQQRAMPAL